MAGPLLVVDQSASERCECGANARGVLLVLVALLEKGDEFLQSGIRAGRKLAREFQQLTQLRTDGPTFFAGRLDHCFDYTPTAAFGRGAAGDDEQWEGVHDGHRRTGPFQQTTAVHCRAGDGGVAGCFVSGLD
jgi:hypothetical protein